MSHFGDLAPNTSVYRFVDRSYYPDKLQLIPLSFRRNRQSKQDMEMAWSDKYEADLLDSEGAHLKPTSTNKQHYAGEARSWPQAAQSTIQSWTQHAHDLILRAEHERMASEQLLHLCQNIINDVARDVIHEKDVVNAAFQKRLDEYQCDKERLICQLRHVGVVTYSVLIFNSPQSPEEQVFWKLLVNL